jgi:predicted outer membrane repeat protein
MRVDNSRFENNQAGYVGGAIYALGSFTDSVTGPVMDLEMNNCLFTGNFVLRDPNGTFTAPTAGGAIQLEGQTRGRFYNCRFINNVAKQGGAVASYRTDNQFQGCVFQNNRATGTAGPDGFGGSIFVISGDLSDSSTVNGTVNRPSGNLSLTDCLFRGPGGGVPSARQGGAIFIGGDLNAMYGDGVQKNGTLEKNRSNVNLKRVVFADLATSDSGNGTGGAMTADFVNLTADQSIVQNCSTTEYGGAFEIIHGSVVNITNTTFVQNRARLLGAVLTMFGGTLNLDGCKFSDNQLTGGGNGGTAIYAVPDRGAGILPPFEMTGTVKNCLFNSLAGYTIYDSDQNPASAPFNRLQYNANQVFPGDRTAYFNDLVGGLVIAQFNSLILSRADGTTSVKSTVANTALASPGTSGAILMVPPTVLSSGAPGETLPIPSYLAYAASGGTPSLDGAAQGTSYGVTQTSLNGIHTLTVGSKSFTTVPPAGVALNISTRLPVGIGQNVLIGGFIIQGPMPKTVILRAIGPSLPLAGTLQDPVLELHNASGATIASNDNWRSTDLGGLLTSGQSIDLIASTVPPSNDAESAILVTLNPGAYTAVVRGANNTTGIAVVEGYDLDADKTSTLANISTRGLVQTGDNVMIGGFIFGGGSAQTNVVVRGIGPSLAAFGINNTLSDPVLELHDANGRLVDANDDWKTNQAAIQATGLQPSNDAESAILVTNLAPGGYTAVLQGKSGGTGVGVVEVYVF